MPIDPTIASSIAVPKPINLLGTYDDALRTGNALTTLQGNRLAIAGAQAQAQAYKDNTDAQGNTNFPKMLGELSQLPGGAYALPEASAAVLARQKQEYDLNQQQLTQTENRTNAFNSALTPLLRLGSNVTPGDVMSTVAGLHASGFPTDEFAHDMVQTMPVMDPSKANDPAAQAAYGKELAGWVYNHAGRSWGAAVGVNTSAPRYQQQDVGGTLRMVDVNPYTNPSIASGGDDASKTFTPGEASSQVNIQGADGKTYSIPRAALANAQGQGGLVSPGTGGASAPSGPFGTGRYGQGGSAPGGAGTAPSGDADPFAGPGVGGDATAPPAPSGAPSAAPNAFGGAATPPGIPAGAVLTGIGPAEAAARKDLGDQSAAEASALFSSAQGVSDRKAQLSSLNADLANAPSGPGAQNATYWSAFANRNFPWLSKIAPGVFQSPDQVASAENFEKTAGRFAQSQANTLGTVTNDKLGSAIASNPNLVFSTLGNQGVIHILQGNEDAIAAKNAAWQNYVRGGGDPSNYQGWATDFNKSGFDPRVFWMKNMTPQERSSYIGTLTPSEQSTFYNNVRTGLSNGWVSPSDFGGAGSGSGSGSPPSAVSAPPASSTPPVDMTAPPAGAANGY